MNFKTRRYTFESDTWRRVVHKSTRNKKHPNPVEESIKILHDLKMRTMRYTRHVTEKGYIQLLCDDSNGKVHSIDVVIEDVV